ncbi:MAG: metal ABC transporter permease [Bacilli bacterium]|nr:metal ABC transporter permease [Bacilli bacterium]
MLTYSFMQIAFVVAILLGASLPLIGSGIVYKRLSSSGDALAHSSLAGVAIGLVSGLNPLLISVITCVVSFLIIELLRKKFSKFSEVGVVVVLSTAIGIAGILSNYAKASNFDSYLFGSIILISNVELIAAIILTVGVLLFSILCYSQFFSGLYSENEAKISGTKVGLYNFIHSLLLSITIAVGAKIVGSLVVSSMVVLPTAIALQFKKGYKATLLISVVVSLISMLSGLTISYYADWSSGATIVLVTVILLVLVFIFRFVKNKIKR